MTDTEKRLLKGLCSFGWASCDPWSAKRLELNHWEIHDSGFICPVCGRAAPDTPEMPTLELFAIPENHLQTCPLRDLLIEAAA